MNICECDECAKYVEHRDKEEERKLWETPQPVPSELSVLLARALCKADAEGYERGFRDGNPYSLKMEDINCIVENEWECWQEEARKIIEKAC